MPGDDDTFLPSKDWPNSTRRKTHFANFMTYVAVLRPSPVAGVEPKSQTVDRNQTNHQRCETRSADCIRKKLSRKRRSEREKVGRICSGDRKTGEDKNRAKKTGKKKRIKNRAVRNDQAELTQIEIRGPESEIANDI